MAVRTRRLNIDGSTFHIYHEFRKKYSDLKLTNSKLFSLALAIGYQNGKRDLLVNKQAFIRYETIDSNLFSIMFLLAINEFDEYDNWIQDPVLIFDIAEEYANAGIKILEGLISDFSFDLESYLSSIIFDLDEESEIQQNFEKFCLD